MNPEHSVWSAKAPASRTLPKRFATKHAEEQIRGGVWSASGSPALWLCLLAVIGLVTDPCRLCAQNPPGAKEPIIEFVQNQVEVLRAGAKTWDAASTDTNHNTLHPGDQLRTGENSRVGLRLPSHKATLILDGNSRFLVPAERQEKSAFELLRGRLFNFHRGGADEQRFKTPTVSAIVRGTDFALKVDDDGTTTVEMLAGEVRLENTLGQLAITSGQTAMVKPGEAPQRTAVIVAVNVIQWCLYYPAVLDAREMSLGNADQSSLRRSLTAYQAGDLLQAMAGLPNDWVNGSHAEQLFGASLLLSLGNVDAARPVLASLAAAEDRTEESRRIARFAKALERLIATVKLERPAPLNFDQTNRLGRTHPSPQPSPLEGRGRTLSTECLVESYRAQGEGNLEQALAFARQAVEANPDFSFALVRVAELEFSFGRLKPAKSAVARALQLSPKNAQAVALHGFVLSAENRIGDALKEFGRAIELDGKLANGWLGRGLCRFRQGQTGAALDDLQMAATVEPQRASLRSCLAKAWSEVGATDKATREILLAEKLDPRDPTAWLYSGLIEFRANNINRAIEDLEESKRLNDNRSLFRSRLLLDEDAAVRSANLAALYRDAGLADVSVREATRAVDRDYGNYSAHLFLAESYDSLRDARQVSLRYETPWFSELLLANLLAPVGAGYLSQNISQQEYSRLLQLDGLGVSSSTEYASRGDWRQAGSIFGTAQRTSFAFDAYYASLNGERPNDDVDQRTFYGKVKQELTPQDTVFLQFIRYENTSGDVRQYYDPSFASATLRFKEVQDPNVYLGFHHEWGPGSHTLFLAARLQDRVSLTDTNARFPAFSAQPNGTVSFGTVIPNFDQSYNSALTAYSLEAQQIWEDGKHTVVAGGRVQEGEVTANSKIRLDPMAFPPNFFGPTNPAAAFLGQSARTALDRYSAYLYFFWDVIPSVQLSAGGAYDYLRFPNNVDLPPITSGHRARDQFSPKAGLRWSLAEDTNLRAVCTRSLGGIYYDASVRLEPSQMAGFNQAFRSAIPESVSGLVPGSRFETWGVGVDHKFGPTTFFGLSVEGLNSKASRLRGAFNFFPPAAAAQYLEELDYHEKALLVDLNKLIGPELAIGTRYRLSHARLSDQFPGIPAALPNDGTFLPAQKLSGVLHELDLNALWNHRSGISVGFQAAFHSQHSSGYLTPLADSIFWQYNATLGYRFLQRRATVQLSLLNLTDQDYRLNPLNLHPDLPRSRTLTVQAGFVF